MNSELRRCPNCGAYVMSSDDLCPRCDYVLRDAQEPAPEAPAGESAAVQAPGPIAPPTAIYDVSELGAAREDEAAPPVQAPGPIAPPTAIYDVSELEAAREDEAAPPVQAPGPIAPPTAIIDIAEVDAAPGEEAVPLVQAPGPIAPPTAMVDLAELVGDREQDEGPSLETDEPPPADESLQVAEWDDAQREADESLAPPADATAPHAAQMDLADLLAGRDLDQQAPPPTVIVPADELEAPMPDEAPPLEQDLPPTEVSPQELPTPARMPLPEVEPLFYTRKAEPRPLLAPETVSPPPRREALKPPAVFPEPPPAVTEGPTMPVEGAPPPSAMHATLPAAGPRPMVPPAPYTPPPRPAPLAPARILPPAPSYVQPGSLPPAPPPGVEAGIAYVQQRVAAYRRGGYRVLTHGQYEASLSRGKRMGAGAWILALVSGIGFLWYLLILAVSGFQRDVVTIELGDDGRVYEDGPGAAHVRGERARAGRRWSAIGMLTLFVGLMAAVLLAVTGGAVLSQERFQAALREAYPAVTLFEEHFSTAQANADDVPLMRDGAIVFSIAALVALVLVWGGATLVVIGTIHAAAYRVRVPPLPRWA